MFFWLLSTYALQVQSKFDFYFWQLLHFLEVFIRTLWSFKFLWSTKFQMGRISIIKYQHTPDNQFFMCRSCRTHIALREDYLYKVKIPLCTLCGCVLICYSFFEIWLMSLSRDFQERLLFYCFDIFHKSWWLSWIASDIKWKVVGNDTLKHCWDYSCEIWLFLGCVLKIKSC